MSNSTTPQESAAFQVTSRLLSRLVIEDLVYAFYIPNKTQQSTGLCVILSAPLPVDPSKKLNKEDVLATVPTRGVPVLNREGTGPYGKQVISLDPHDMVHVVFEITPDQERMEIHNKVSDISVFYE